MQNDLWRLVYYSRNRISDDLAQEVQAILATSRRNNEQAGVTGALLFNSGCFGQILEGPRRAVEATFERIQRDTRHGDVSLLDFSPLGDRGFAAWSMAFVGTRESDRQRFSELAEESDFDPSRMSADGMFETLHRLALGEEHSG